MNLRDIKLIKHSHHYHICHHYQILIKCVSTAKHEVFDDDIEKRDYDIKNLIVMQKARELLALTNWTCGHWTG